MKRVLSPVEGGDEDLLDDGGISTRHRWGEVLGA